MVHIVFIYSEGKLFDYQEFSTLAEAEEWAQGYYEWNPDYISTRVETEYE
jgi:hypothetical protein